MKDIIEPAVDGTLSLLGSVVKSKDTIERVVLTSSIAGGLTLRVHGKHLIACLQSSAGIREFDTGDVGP